jgi:ATP-dependent phosphoenolpyruvate carboxykinase
MVTRSRGTDPFLPILLLPRMESQKALIGDRSVSSKTSVSLSLEDRELIILCTEYAGEMKKGVFTVAN